MMKLLSNEKEIFSIENNKIKVTTHRLYIKESSWGNSESIQFFLEDITSIEISSRSTIWLLVVGLVLILFGFYLTMLPGTTFDTGMLFCGVLLLIAYALSRQSIIRITSAGTRSAKIPMKGLSESTVEDFIHIIQNSKSIRKSSLQLVQSF